MGKFQVGDSVKAKRNIYFLYGESHRQDGVYEVTKDTLSYYNCVPNDYELVIRRGTPMISSEVIGLVHQMYREWTYGNRNLTFIQYVMTHMKWEGMSISASSHKDDFVWACEEMERRRHEPQSP